MFWQCVTVAVVNVHGAGAPVERNQTLPEGLRNFRSIKPARHHCPFFPPADQLPTMSTESRHWELDALRGLMLVLMTVTHLPTRLSEPLGQPFGYVSAAEGFVLLSAFMAGAVYGKTYQHKGVEPMKSAFFNRALKLYACQLALLMFAFTIIAGLALLGREDAVLGLLAFNLKQPWVALASASLLLYNPALLDILPIYIVFLLLSPIVLMHGMERGWGQVLAISGLVWLGAQFGLGPALYGVITGWFDMPIRYHDMGSFETLAWQFLWVIGLWLGATQNQPGTAPLAFPRPVLLMALVMALCSFLWRHAVGQSPLPGYSLINQLFSKWYLGPLRLINLLALVVLVVHFGPWLKQRLPRVRALEGMGRAALPVFCAHLVVALLALALFGASRPDRPLAVDLLILFAGFYTLHAVARVSLLLDRRRADSKHASRPRIHRKPSGEGLKAG